LQVGTRVARLRVHLGVGGHFDVEVVTGFGADELDQLARVAQVARADHARRQVAPQRHQALGAERAVELQQAADLLPRAAHARDVWRRVVAVLATQALDRLGRVAEGGAAGAEGHADVVGRVVAQPRRGAVQLRTLLLGLGRIELEADGDHGRAPTIGSAQYIASSG